MFLYLDHGGSFMSDVSEFKPFLGCYIIVRDAENTIEALLESIEFHFNEIVIVDTGSTDGTKQKILDFFSRLDDIDDLAWPNIRWHDSVEDCRVVFADFTWVDDFSAARNFAYSLGAAKWRMYLDADDIFADAKQMIPMLRRTELEHPDANCISMKYEYVPNELPQDVIRCVRWDDGWLWEDPLHEHLVASNHPRVISKYTDVWVKHRPVGDHATKSFTRNLAIAAKAYETAPNAFKKGLWAFYLADYRAELGDITEADRLYAEAELNLGQTNLACQAFVRHARMLVNVNTSNLPAGVELSAQAIGRAPELPDGYASMAILLAQQGAMYRAAGVFDQLKALPIPPMESTHDTVLIDGLANLVASEVYFAVGRVDDARIALDRIPEGVRHHHSLIERMAAQVRVLIKHHGLQTLKAMYDFYLWDTEPLKALALLENAPAAIAEMPEIVEMRAFLQARLPHLNSWADYKAVYASIPDSQFHTALAATEGVKGLGRTQQMVIWAERLHKDGPAIEMLSIGAQDCVIEAEIMKRNSRINFTVCDVGPQASVGFKKLEEEFPGRVQRYEILLDHYDWGTDTNKYDGVILFEVIEHLPDAKEGLDAIWNLLKLGGTLFLSCPVADAWVESYLTDPKAAPAWYGHVRAFNPSSLLNVLRTGWITTIKKTDTESIFFATAIKCAQPTSTSKSRVSIFVPGAAPFDPESLLEGHLGGSEEAVVHLAEALSTLNLDVTVYANVPPRDAQIVAYNNVLWCPLNQFAVNGAHSTVLVWRAPKVAAQLIGHGYRVLNWLHDTHYTVPTKTYEVVDGSFVLSGEHEKVVRAIEAGSNAKILRAANGIISYAFDTGAQRDPHKVIYASSPDRGLIYLLRMWPRIKSAVPTASLDIYYSWDGMRKRIESNPEFAKAGKPLLAELEFLLRKFEHLDVKHHGGVSHPELHKAYASSSIWAYPTDFFEISCISAMKAQAAGCWPVVFANGALPETVRNGQVLRCAPGNPSQKDLECFEEALIEKLKHPPTEAERAEMSRDAKTAFSWEKAAKMFYDEFTRV